MNSCINILPEFQYFINAPRISSVWLKFARFSITLIPAERSPIDSFSTAVIFQVCSGWSRIHQSNYRCFLPWMERTTPLPSYWTNDPFFKYFMWGRSFVWRRNLYGWGFRVSLLTPFFSALFSPICRIVFDQRFVSAKLSILLSLLIWLFLISFQFCGQGLVSCEHCLIRILVWA
jgi:hypothetical protein